MKKILLIISILFIGVACSEDNTLAPDSNESFINQGSDGHISESSEVDLKIEGRSVGKLFVNLRKDSVFLDYELNDEDVVISNLKFHIATNKLSLPSSAGNLSPASFLFSESNLRLSLAEITGVSGYKGPLFFSFFGQLAHFTSPAEEESVETTIKSTHTLADKSYFRALLSTGSSETEYSAYCLQGDQSMDTSVPHFVKRLLSLSKDESKLESVIDNPLNLGIVNWILNQPVDKWKRKDGSPANGADRQMAIWKLIETTGNPTGVNIKGIFEAETVAKIVQDALVNGQGYKPKCGDKVLVILHKGPIGSVAPNGAYNTGSYANPNYQVTGIVYSIDCFGELGDCWALGKPYGAQSSGSYFAMLKQ